MPGPEPILILSDLAYQAILKSADHDFQQTATRRTDGNWSVPVGLDILEKIDQERYAGETDSDVILRIACKQVN